MDSKEKSSEKQKLKKNKIKIKSALNGQLRQQSIADKLSIILKKSACTAF